MGMALIRGIEDTRSGRAGSFVQQTEGYRAFVPKPLPPVPPVEMSAELISLLSRADRAIGRLDGITCFLPNPDLFVEMYVKKEALLSSQIEGTQASFVDVITASKGNENDDQKDVSNYVAAMKYGMERIETLPFSLRLIREIHKVLLSKGRGSDRSPGEFCTSQNWIGARGCTLATSVFVPPTPADMMTAMGELELFFHAEDTLPPLIKIALIHAQFETIHPFLDGNGRMGRLLITFWLYRRKILSRPLLYLSAYFKKNRETYYERLLAVRREGDWEGWVRFFLTGLATVADEAVDSARRIIALENVDAERLRSRRGGPQKALDLLALLFRKPVQTRTTIRQQLKISYPTASALVEEFCTLGILAPCGQNKRDMPYRYPAYLSILEEGTK